MRPHLQSRNRFSIFRSRFPPSRTARKRIVFRLRLLAIVTGLAILLVIVDSRLRPLVRSYSVNQAKTISARAVNDAVTAVLSDASLDYSDLITVVKDEAGELSSMQTDILKINQLKATVTNAVLDELAKHKELQIHIPLGTILGGDLLSGRGPLIPLKVSLTATAVTTMNSKFSSAGINQTNHRMILNVDIVIFAAVPGYSYASMHVQTEFIVAETVLIGRVPDSFTEVNDDRSDILGKIFDYADIE